MSLLHTPTPDGRDQLARAHRDPRGGARASNEKAGSVTLFFGFLMVVFLGVAMVTMNIFRVFLTHAHLQVSVDNAVYSGAVLQARGLNEIARINTEINRELHRSANAVGRGIYANKSAGWDAVDREWSRFETFNRAQRTRQTEINRQQTAEATRVAQDIANRNQAGLPSVQFSEYTHDQARLTEMKDRDGDDRNFSFRYYYYVTVTRGSGENARRVRVRRTGFASGPCVEAIMQAKGTTDHTYFSARLRQSALPFPFTLGGLWPTTFENLRVYATAMPFGGYLWDGSRARADYDVKLVRTGEVRPRPLIPDAWGYEW